MRKQYHPYQGGGGTIKHGAYVRRGKHNTPLTISDSDFVRERG